jgi:N-acetyl-anhydromuramoyl-L-alanine amidase
MICGMRIDLATGLIARARQVLSPYFDARPSGSVTDLIVIHGISLPPGEFGGASIDQLFTGNLDPEAHPFFRDASRLRVSTHVLIRRDGSIVQYVPFQARAWHAGESQYEGRSVCNDFSVGIELEGTDELPYEDAQYESLAHLIRALLAAYPSLSAKRVVGHCDIAPGRKTDPGRAFDWQRLRQSLC